MLSLLEERKRQSLTGLSDVRAELAARLSSIAPPQVAIYVTGSFGRLEARYPAGSDLDVFFLYAPDDDPEGDKDLPRLEWFRLIAGTIDVAEKLRFEPFSKDGEFLKAHNVKRIGRQLGSRHEDAENVFTARILLLLESQYLVNERLYDELLLETIKFYFGDYATNRERFRPQSLINDILRYWRTLCLNYEHSRNKLRSSTDDSEGQAAFRAKSTLDNLKLRHSRLALCFSMIAVLGSEPAGMSPERVRELCRIVPSERWEHAADQCRENRARAHAVMRELLARYEEFLELAADERAILETLRNPEERADLRRRGSGFGDLVYELLRLVVPDDQFRRLVV
jgi:hypothetical protein